MGGPMDLKKGTFVMAKRNALGKEDAKIAGKHGTLEEDVTKTLDCIYQVLYDKALTERNARIADVDKWEDFTPNLNKGKLVLVPFCGRKEGEERIKEKTKEEAADE